MPNGIHGIGLYISYNKFKKHLEHNRMNIYACIINIQVPHEVKNERAKAKRTPQIM